MNGLTRGVATLVGAAVAGFLVWLATQVETTDAAGFWLAVAVLAVAGLALALSQLLGGWTKWGWPRLSLGVFLLGFLPVLAAGLWLAFAHQPGSPLLDTAAWSSDLGVDGVVESLGELLPVVAFGVGLTFGFVFDTAGPPAVHEPADRDVAYGRLRAEDEPLAAERNVADDSVATREREARPGDRL